MAPAAAISVVIKRARFVMMLALAGAATPSWAGLCSLCRRTLEQSGNTGLIRGYAWSVVLIGGMGLFMLGVAVRTAWRLYNPKPRA